MTLQDYVASFPEPGKRDQAARKLGISPRTLHRWLHDDAAPINRTMQKKLRRMNITLATTAGLAA